MRLSELSQGAESVVQEVEDVVASDPIARRLRDYGFVRGEPVRLVMYPSRTQQRAGLVKRIEPAGREPLPVSRPWLDK